MINDITIKDKEREALQRQVEDYLNGGGEVKYIEKGLRADRPDAAAVKPDRWANDTIVDKKDDKS